MCIVNSMVCGSAIVRNSDMNDIIPQLRYYYLDGVL